MSSFRPFFNAEIQLEYDGKSSRNYCRINNDQRSYGGFFITGFISDTVSLVGPNFDLANVAAGLLGLKVVLEELPENRGCIAVKDYHRVVLQVGVQGGIESDAANLLAKKIATLAMVLEESLLLKLVAPASGRHIYPVNEKSKVVRDRRPHIGAVSSDYDSHVPPIAAIKPAAWNSRDPEHVCRVLTKIWSSPSPEELQSLLNDDWMNCDFYLEPEKREYLSQRWPSPRNDPSFTRNQDLEEYHPWFCFRHLQTTFEHRLLRNWVEVISRIVELAMAGPDEYRACLEAIFRIQHDADQGGVAWEQLMTHVLKLEHRIQDWRDQLARYEQGEILASLPKNGLPKLRQVDRIRYLDIW
ncbi:hypothetical protein CDV31_003087 [Fusarium ambrosium]|uniref:Uncharacterized protein n=1 Tax=Fusarium ambrosium TaxID=131363 RepID=A0A428UV55_9HYPO|nr:hypothetical protein CDV31_003087 [Fusarium ambrosium]